MVLMHRSTSTYVLNVRFVLGWGITFFYKFNNGCSRIGYMYFRLELLFQDQLYAWQCCSIGMVVYLELLFRLVTCLELLFQDWLHAWNRCSRIGCILEIVYLLQDLLYCMLGIVVLGFVLCQESLFQEWFHARKCCSRIGGIYVKNCCSRIGGMLGIVVLLLVVQYVRNCGSRIGSLLAIAVLGF